VRYKSRRAAGAAEKVGATRGLVRPCDTLQAGVTCGITQVVAVDVLE
jgi:hypothetical protein